MKRQDAVLATGQNLRGRQIFFLTNSNNSSKASSPASAPWTLRNRFMRSTTSFWCFQESFPHSPARHAPGTPAAPPPARNA
jgi:hypothetical protein